MNQTASTTSSPSKQYGSIPPPTNTKESNGGYKEGSVAKSIEQQTKKIPSDWFMWAAFGAMGLSAALQFSDQKRTSHFVAEWVPTLLLFGIYNKIVKVMGSDGEQIEDQSHKPSSTVSSPAAQYS